MAICNMNILRRSFVEAILHDDDVMQHNVTFEELKSLISSAFIFGEDYHPSERDTAIIDGDHFVLSWKVLKSSTDTKALIQKYWFNSSINSQNFNQPNVAVAVLKILKVIFLSPMILNNAWKILTWEAHHCSSLIVHVKVRFELMPISGAAGSSSGYIF